MREARWLDCTHDSPLIRFAALERSKISRAGRREWLVQRDAVFTVAAVAASARSPNAQKKTRSRSIMAKCLWLFAKAHRNAVRRHLKAGERKLALREAEAEQANAFISLALREGWATTDLVRSLYRAGDEARPYRPEDIHCAVGAFLKAISDKEPPTPLRSIRASASTR